MFQLFAYTRMLIVGAACVMVMASPARAFSSSRMYFGLRGSEAQVAKGSRSASPSHKALRERFWGKLAEANVIRHVGNSQDLRKAIVSLRERTLLLQRLKFTQEAANGYLLLGELYDIQSRFDLAATAYLHALHLSPKDAYLHCSSMSHLARVYTAIGHWEDALSYSQIALKSARDLKCWAEALHAQAEALYYSNSHDDLHHSLELSLLAADVFQDLGDPDAQAQALLSAGHSAFQMGSDQDGFHLAEEAFRLWYTMGGRYGEALAQAALGYFSIRMGNPAASFSYYSRAQKTFAEVGDQDNEAIVYNGLGLLAREIGNTDEAYEDFDRARRLFCGAHDLIGEASAVDNKAAIVWNRQNYREAKQLYRYELELAQRARHSRLEAAAYLGMGSVLEAEGSYQQAFSYCHKALQLNQVIHHNYGAGESWRCLGRIYAKQRRDNDALTAFNKALTFKISVKEPEQAAVHHEIAAVYQRRGQSELARTEIEKAIQLIESERIKVSGFDNRASYFASVHEYYQLYVEVLMELHDQHPEQGFAQKAFEAWERGKMRSLLDMLANGGRNCPSLERASVVNAAETIPIRAQEVSVDEQPCTAVSALSLGKIKQEIREDGSIIVEYSLGAKAGYVWVVTDKNLWSYKIPHATDVPALVERFQAALLARLQQPRNPVDYAQSVRRADQEYLQAAQALAQLLLAPIADLLSDKRIILVADGPLQHVPFSVLPFPSSDGQAALLRDHNELVYLPSASTLKFIREAAGHRPLPTMQAVAFADPVFGPEDLHLASPKKVNPKQKYPWELRAVLRDMHRDHGRLPRLPGTADEATAISDIMGSERVLVVTGVKATREAVLNGHLGNYRHILFATHSLLDEKHPELSGLVFSLVNEEGKDLDGYLRVKDIYQLKLSAETVVLSSCESALGKDLQSEGMIGLTRAFLYAGSKRVVSSLWKVDDAATAELIRHFYQWIHDGKNPGESLRRAQADLSKNPRWQHPYYWAGFILQGEYRPIESMESQH